MVAIPDPTGDVEEMSLDGIFARIISKEGKKFPCHRIILATKSFVMKAMFSMDMRDKEEKETKVHYNNQMVEAFAKLFYKGAVTHTVLVANLSSFLALSDLYDLLLLKS